MQLQWAYKFATYLALIDFIIDLLSASEGRDILRIHSKRTKGRYRNAVYSSLQNKKEYVEQLRKFRQIIFLNLRLSNIEKHVRYCVRYKDGYVICAQNRVPLDFIILTSIPIYTCYLFLILTTAAFQRTLLPLPLYWEVKHGN